MIMNKKKVIFGWLIVLFIVNSAYSAEDTRIQWWKEAKFGLFLNWGPVSLVGKDISWCRGLPRPGEEYATWDQSVPSEVYDQLYKKFNPVEFNADQWVQLAKDAGMKYIIYDAKHHDGFAHFDSKYSDYKITSPESPFGRDIIKELADACHRADMRFGVYYSPPDWHNPDYLGPEHDTKFINYFHGQVEELCNNYGKIDVIWFDGLRGNAEDWHSQQLIKNIKKWQPEILINNRLGVEGDMGTPEQVVGKFDRNRPWESCITITSQWTWGGNENTKSYEECMKILLNTAGGDGNLLFNVAPNPQGSFDPAHVEIIKKMGQWLKKYGQTIYSTRGGPFKPGDFGVSTCKDNKIYLHVMNFNGQELKLNPLSAKIEKAELLTAGNVDFKQDDTGITITVAKEFQQDIDTIIELTIDKPSVEINPIDPIVSAEKQAQRKELNIQNEAEILKAQKLEKQPTPMDQIILDDNENLVIVPAGKFPFRGKEVFVDTFAIQKYEVTNYQYCQFLNSCENPDSHGHSSKMQKLQQDQKTLYQTKPGFENYPAVNVAYQDACAYADWKTKTTGLKYTVPTEAQWEKAAAWDPIKKHYYNYAIQSDDIQTNKFACSSSIMFNRDVEDFYAPIAVGSYNAKSYYGCYDMSGNVKEWTSDMIDDNMIMKGGSYWNYHISCRCFSRCPMNATYAGGDRGFRLAVNLE